MSVLLALLLAAQPSAAPDLAMVAVGDFDRDGWPDQAYVETRRDARMRLVVVPGRPHAARIVVTTIDMPDSFRFQAVHRGRYTPACVQGLRPARCAASSIELGGDALAFGNAGQPEAVAIWNGAGFNRIFLAR